MIRANLAGLLAALLILAGGDAARAADDAVIILDASGSMWGQVQSEAKMAAAKRVLGQILDEVPSSRRLGLFAYGHRREGDCRDIEEIAPLGTDRAAIKAAAAALVPKGKTPMSDAVRAAAAALRYTERKATIVLVSDGIETCAADPCAAAAALEAAGADLTVHVIGFDVAEENAQAQLRCIAESTGGRFVSAANAAELTGALKATVADPRPVVAAQNLSLRATELQGGLVIESGLEWAVTPEGGEKPLVSKAGQGKLDVTVPPGRYDIAVKRTADRLKGAAKGVAIAAGAQKTVTIALEFPVSATIRTEPAAKAVAGTTIKVHWTGPDRRGDFIAVAAKDAGPGASEGYSYTRLGNPAELRLPVTPGAYEIRYVLGRPYKVLASVPIEAAPAEATLAAPAEAVAGAEVEIAFTGPPANANDYVAVTRPDDAETKHMGYAYTRLGSPARLRMPLEPGAYELRFVQNGRRVLARRPITITAAQAQVSAKAEAVAGEIMPVAFSGPPVGPGDYITVTAPGAPDRTHTDYAYARNGSPGNVRMPLEAGLYEIRYVQAGSKVLARQAIKVIPAVASLSAPAETKAGASVDIAFTAPPPGPRDYIVVAEQGAPDLRYIAYGDVRNGSPARIKMPPAPGAYEIRFIQAGKKVLARRPIRIAAP